MIKETRYSWEYERWITPVHKHGDTFCIVFGKSSDESKKNARIVQESLDLYEDNKIHPHSNYGDRHSGWSV